MSTNINIRVDNSGLLDRVRVQQQASRQAQLEKEDGKRLEVRATGVRTKALAAKNLDTKSEPFIGTGTQVPKIERDPAASRIDSAEETVSAAVVGWRDTDWLFASSFSRSFSGENKGPSVYISSLDGSFWLEDLDIPEGIADWNFVIPQELGIGGGFGLGALKMWQYCVFPTGRGNFVLTMRLQQAGVWSASDGQGNIYGEASTPQDIFFSYSVFTSYVKKIDTPEAAKNFLRRKNTKLIVTTTYLGNPALQIDPSWLANSFFVGVGLNTSMSFDYINPGEEGQLIPSRGDIGRSSPFIYAMNDHEGGDIVNYDNFANFDNAKYQAGKLNTTGKSYARRLGIVVDSFVNNSNYLQSESNLGEIKIDLYTLNGEIFIDWKTPTWSILSSSLLGTFEFWRQSTEAKFIGSSSSSSFVFKTSSPIPGYGPTGSLPLRVNALLCSDWAMPAFCRQQLLALGFSAADLKP